MIRIDFVQAIPRRLKILRRSLLAASVVAAVTVFLWTDALQQRLQGLAWQKESVAVPANTQRAAARDAGTSTPKASEVLRDLEIDWRSLFAAVEGAVATDIRMMAIRPDPLRQLLQIEAKAADGTKAQRFIERLQRDGTITDAHLVREERNDDDGLLSFTVRAHWEVKR